MEMVNKGVETRFEGIREDFRAIDFSGNRFYGKIPEFIGFLKELHLLNLSNNAFTSDIPQSLENLTNLETLDLSSNKLSGQIPQDLGKLSFLSYMNFSHNLLQGPVPRGTQFQKQKCSSFSDNPGLYGLEEICGGPHYPNPTSQANEELSESEEPVFNWIAAAMAYGPGVFFELPDTSIETRLQPPSLDAGEPFGRQRRVLRFSSSHLSRFRFVSTVYVSPPTWFSVSVNISSHAKFLPRRKLVLGIPQPVEILAGFSSRFPSQSSCCYAHLPLDEYPPLVGVEAIHPLQVEPHKPDPPPSPHQNRKNRKSFSYLPTLCLISPSVGLRPEPMTHHSPNVSHPVTRRCTSTAVLSSFRRAFSLEKQTTTSLLRSVLLPNIKWKCPSISISVLLSCVAVRLGPEDATGFVSAILRGEDWMLTSL
uniref:Leucine-rich repeat-containing N-terminal plant-type domain-containing protein n=1 Tax=Brassica oleracea var. oleracea TaxID=109376 RepID=A0A0D3CZU8_BRAOL